MISYTLVCIHIHIVIYKQYFFSMAQMTSSMAIWLWTLGCALSYVSIDFKQYFWENHILSFCMSGFYFKYCDIDARTIFTSTHACLGWHVTCTKWVSIYKWENDCIMSNTSTCSLLGVTIIFRLFLTYNLQTIYLAFILTTFSHWHYGHLELIYLKITLII